RFPLREPGVAFWRPPGVPTWGRDAEVAMSFPLDVARSFTSRRALAWSHIFLFATAVFAFALIIPDPSRAAPSCGNWSLVDPSGAAEPGAAWDPMNGRILRAGGGQSQTPLQIWQFTFATGWTQVTTSGIGPVDRTGPGFLFDPVRNRMLLISGMRLMSPG